jgi:hypothetical protein
MVGLEIQPPGEDSKSAPPQLCKCCRRGREFHRKDAKYAKRISINHQTGEAGLTGLTINGDA